MRKNATKALLNGVFICCGKSGKSKHLKTEKWTISILAYLLPQTVAMALKQPEASWQEPV